MTENVLGIDELVDFATDAILDSGKRALAYYGKGKPNVKFDEELITKAELDLSEFFEERLKKHYPHHTVFKDVEKEKEYSHDEKRYLWIFDPLDGVANFQAGIPVWGMSLALIENFWPVLGLVYMPSTGDLFHARAGGDAFRGKEKIDAATSETVNDETLMFTYSRFNRDFKTAFPGKIRSLGCTSAHISYVAMGRADAAVISNESFKGLAAAHVIIEAAGGKISKLNGKKFFLNDYVDGHKIESRLVATAPGVLNQVIACLKKI